MKSIKSLSLLISCFLILSSSKCDNDDFPPKPLDELPPATQVGAQTFGCLINGEPFIPPKFGSNAPRAFYQFVRGAYTFNISGSIGGGSELETIFIGGIDVSELQEGNFILTEEQSGKTYGEYLIGGGLVFSGTTITSNPGILTFTKIDTENFIISGTFSFTVQDEDGNNYNITEGRFDLNYTN